MVWYCFFQRSALSKRVAPSPSMVSVLNISIPPNPEAPAWENHAPLATKEEQQRKEESDFKTHLIERIRESTAASPPLLRSVALERLSLAKKRFCTSHFRKKVSESPRLRCYPRGYLR